MKTLLLWLFLAVSITAYAQIPSYYNDVNLSQSGTDLKDDLATKIISTHTTYLSYTPGVWSALQQSDVDPNNSSNVLLIYGHKDTDGNVKTDRTRGKYTNGGSVGDWNREHVFAKSLANPSLGTSGAGADAHNLRPCDMQQNSSRNNRKFGTGSGAAAYINSSSDWYPGDEWKGDTARMIMFMYLRYGNRCLPTFVGTGSSVSSDANMVDLFLQWNAEDPVSAFETQRNNVVAGIQGNRNPFVDNPAFATQIWGGPQAEDKFGNGGTDPGTNPGTGGGSADDLFFSEYIEGSSYNKAIEIANSTGSSVNLSSYTIKKQTNGAGSWSSAYALSGSLSNGSVYVIANSSANTTIKNQADVTTGNTIVTFNGNDAVGLFKNNVLIDIIGNYSGGSSNFAKDVTLVRKASITSPNTSYTVSEWDSYTRDTTSYLGSHTTSSARTAYVMSVAYKEEAITLQEEFTVFPNPVRNQLHVNSNLDKNTTYQIHSIIGQVVKVGNLANKTINVANLQSGIYILQINDGDEILTKKFIKQ